MRVMSVGTCDSIRNRRNFLMITLITPRSAHISLAVYSKEYQQLKYTRVSPDERYDANQHSFKVGFATRDRRDIQNRLLTIRLKSCMYSLESELPIYL